MGDDPKSRPKRKSAGPLGTDPHESALESQLERLHEQVVAGQASDDFVMIDGRLEPRLQAAQQLLNLIEQVRSAESVGLVDRLAPPPDLPSIELTKPIGPYQLLAEVGRGGMGIVFRARDSRLERDVAIKIVSPLRLANAEWLPRFQREARAASALNHPNILTVHEIGEANGQHYIATELVDGETLRKKMLSGRLSVHDSLSCATQLASALAAAHQAGIVHRDLKPDNIMIRQDGLLKVLDFGLAKHVFTPPLEVAIGESRHESAFASEAGIIIGTVRYMSPEQARGLPVDERTDIFSLGVIMYEMLTGRHPFEAATSSDVLAAILDRSPLPFTDLAPRVPADVAQIVLKCLHKVREQRYSSAAELLGALQPLKDNSAFVSRDASESDICDSRRSSTSYDIVTINHHLEGDSQEQIPSVHYALSGDVNIAYQVLGKGPFDLVFVMGWVSHLEWFWKEPSFAAFLRRLATFSRVILFDKRGTGLSDKVPVDQLPTLEQRMDDVRAVMDAVGSKRAVLCGISEGGPMCTLFAATYPEKTIALTMIGCYARRLWASDYPWGPTEEQRNHFLEEIRRDWGGPVGIEDRAPTCAHDPDFRRWWGTYLRMGASPGAALALTNMNAQIDIRPILPTIQVPTLVIHRTSDRCLRVDEGRYLAENIPGSKWVELPGADHLPFVGDQDSILDEIEEFLTGVRQPHEVDRVLATVLYVSIKQSDSGTDPTVDASTTSPTQKFSAHVVREVDLFRGRNLNIDHHSAVALFDGPARAIRAAIAIKDSATRLAVQVGIGVHTGECDMVQERPSGTTVDLTRDISLRAECSEVLVSATVRDLVVGSGLTFVDHSILKTSERQLDLYQVSR